MSRTLAEAKQLLRQHIEDLKGEEKNIREHRERHEKALMKWKSGISIKDLFHILERTE